MLASPVRFCPVLKHKRERERMRGERQAGARIGSGSAGLMRKPIRRRRRQQRGRKEGAAVKAQLFSY